MKAYNRFRLHARVSNLLANQQAFSHEQASFRMLIFCNLNTLRDQYGGFLHERLRAYKRLCNVNAALGSVHSEASQPAYRAGALCRDLTSSLIPIQT